MNTPRATAGPGAGPNFTLEDFRGQLERLKQLGLVGDVLPGTPGRDDRITGGEGTVPSLRRIQGMIDAMTRTERDSPDILDNPRCRRIAAGAGVRPQDVELFLGQFQQLRVVMKQMAQLSIWREGGA
jgi:signal recognition particle subunit SRP54